MLFLGFLKRRRMKRLAFVTTRNFETFGGAERYIDNLIKHYQRPGISLVILAPASSKGRVREKDGIKYVYYKITSKHLKNFFRFFNPVMSVLAQRRAIYQKLNEVRPDSIATRDYDAVLAISLSGCKAPLYFMPGSLLKMDLMLDFEFKGSFLYRLSRNVQCKIKILLEYLAFRACTKIIVFSNTFKQRIVKNYNIKEGKISVIPIGISIEPSVNAVAIDKGSILSVCRLSKSKNVLMIPEIAKRLNGFHWFIAGDGPEKESLKVKISKLGLKNRVTLLGQLSSIDEYYNKCEAFVHLSYYENFGQVLLEAMLHGKPPIVLSTDAPGIYTASSEIIKDGHNGFFVTNDVATISDKIQEVMTSDTMAISDNCKRFAKRYSFKEHLNALFNIIQEGVSI